MSELERLGAALDSAVDDLRAARDAYGDGTDHDGSRYRAARAAYRAADAAYMSELIYGQPEDTGSGDSGVDRG